MTSASEIGPADKFGEGRASTIIMATHSPDPPRSVLILYGTETGNAQEVAEELGAMAERLRFSTHVAELNQSKPVCAIYHYSSIAFFWDIYLTWLHF